MSATLPDGTLNATLRIACLPSVPVTNLCAVLYAFAIRMLPMGRNEAGPAAPATVTPTTMTATITIVMAFRTSTCQMDTLADRNPGTRITATPTGSGCTSAEGVQRSRVPDGGRRARSGQGP